MMATVVKHLELVTDSFAPSRPPTRVANILLVDDKRENLVALEAVLRPLKQNLVTATSGEEALKCLLKKDFAVILMDVKMPHLDGFETAAYVKQLERTRHIPIIFLTAISKDQGHVFRGYSAGAIDYVVKPFDPVVLRSKVAAFIELYEKTLALHESEERFKRAFANAPIGLALVDLEGRFQMVNRALCEMTGYDGSQLLTMDLTMLCDPRDAEWDFEEMSRGFAEDKRGYHGERLLQSAAGEEVHVLMSASFVPRVRDTAPYFIFQSTDITRRKLLETFRERFVANAAHELRTPTSIIMGATEMLVKGFKSLSERDINNCLEILDRQGARLSSVVSTLLDMARLEEGRFELNPTQVPVLELAQLVVAATEPGDDTHVTISIEPDVVAWADRDVLDRIVTNLLVNAYKYGGPNITIAADTGTDTVSLSVTDDGEGVPPDLVRRLFDPFARGATAARVGGSGLGLSLVRGLAQAMAGDALYSAVEPQGASFTVVLPRRSPDA